MKVIETNGITYLQRFDACTRPEKVDFLIGERESFCVRKDGELLFSEWYEEPEYREEINVREYPSGNLIEKMSRTVMTMPDNQNWIFR